MSSVFFCVFFFFFFKQKTAYEMRISDWSSDVCSSDLTPKRDPVELRAQTRPLRDAIAKLDKQIAKLQSELAQLEAKLADHGLYESGRAEELKNTLARQSELSQQLQSAAAHGLTQTEQRDVLDKGEDMRVRARGIKTERARVEQECGGPGHTE